MTAVSNALTRRTLLSSGTAAAGLAATPGFAKAVAAAATSPSAFRVAIDGIAEEILTFSPETATSLGVDTGARATLRAKFADGSEAGNARFAAAAGAMMNRLRAIDRKTLPPADQLRWDTVHYALESAAMAKPFFYATAAGGFFGGTSPYAITQQGGAVANIPEFLDSQHPVNTSADAEAYLSRVAGMAKALDDETAQIRRDAARGVMPPDFIAKTVLGQLTGYRKTAIAEQKLVTSVAKRTADKGITGDWAARATKLTETMVYPALDRQIAAFTEATRNAPHDAGVQRLPNGDAYYHPHSPSKSLISLS